MQTLQMTFDQQYQMPSLIFEHYQIMEIFRKTSSTFRTYNFSVSWSSIWSQNVYKLYKLSVKPNNARNGILFNLNQFSFDNLENDYSQKTTTTH